MLHGLKYDLSAKHHNTFKPWPYTLIYIPKFHKFAHVVNLKTQFAMVLDFKYNLFHIYSGIVLDNFMLHIT